MAHLESRKHISPDSGFPITLHRHCNPKITSHSPPEALREAITVEKDRAAYADPGKKALFSVAKRVDLTESIGTQLEDVQLLQLNEQQLDELALLVNKRGVVFFRNQDLTAEQQVALFRHYGILDRHPAQKDQRHVIIKGSTEDHREILSYTPWPSGDYHADTSFEINSPSYSMLSMEEHAEIPIILPYEPILFPGRKALNVNNGFVTGLAELKKKESDFLQQFFEYHIHSADDHQVGWKWEVGSVAMWDNRCTLHRVIPEFYDSNRRGIRTTVFGEKPYFDLTSESRNERALREGAGHINGKVNGYVNGQVNGSNGKVNGHV